MPFEFSDLSKQSQINLSKFLKEHILPIEDHYRDFTYKNHWVEYPQLEELKTKAKQAKLWNLFLPKSYDQYSPGLSNLDYAPLAETMGRVLWSSQVFNCSAPDTGNMEILAKFGTAEQKEKWLQPLLSGEIRSAFLMTEPHVASSDATNISCSIHKVNSNYIINGHKWWSTGALHPRTRFFIVMGKTNKNESVHKQQSMIIVPSDAPGIKIVRSLHVFGYNESPEGHAEIILKDVSVPSSNIILGEGDGFYIAQSRLGPGRIHHCMRLIGCCQRALELVCSRVANRVSFGNSLSSYTNIRQDIAKMRCDIEQARLLTLSAAESIDNVGISQSKEIISMIKIVVPSMACQLIDKAIQLFGGMGVCQDTPLAEFYIYARALRIADGPDEVHMNQLGKNTIKSFNP